MASLYSRNPMIEIAPMRNEMVLFNPRNGKFCLLNATAAHLWSELETPHTIQELADSIESHFDNVDINQASRDVEVALSQLSEVECVLNTQTD